MPTVDITPLAQWVGRTESRDDVVTPAPLRALASTLDYPDEPWPTAREVPPFWHWLYFLPTHRQSELGPDGHAQRGGFLPPVALPRRMWAGSRITFAAPLRLGQSMRRTSTIEAVRAKEGRSGLLVFVTVRHEIHAEGALALVEHQDIVYRDATKAGEPGPAPVAAPSSPTWSRRIAPDPVLLFRYSALTFNGHRIHYDQPFTVRDEGYPGIIVHGPLIATLLLDLLHRSEPGARVSEFSFRAMKPLFSGLAFDVCGERRGNGKAQLWARSPEGHVAMQAEATLG